MDAEKPELRELSKVLAVLLVEQGSYTYIDKLAQVSSKDLALYHIRETLRDYNSLVSRGINNEEAKVTADSIDFLEIESVIEKISNVSSVSELREIVSFITAQALAESARIKTRSTYSIGVKILDEFKSRGMSFGKDDELAEAIKRNQKELAEKLGVDEDVISDIARNRVLLRYLIRRG